MATTLVEMIRSRLMKDGLRHVDRDEILRGGDAYYIGKGFSGMYGEDLTPKWALVEESVSRTCSEDGYSVFSEVTVSTVLEDITIGDTVEVPGPIYYRLHLMVA